MPEFKDMLKYFRKKAGLSQTELADKLGLSTSTIGMYESGRRQPNFEIEEKMADFFNTDLNTLRGKKVDQQQQNYYINPETAQIAQEIYDNKELSLLFDAAKDASREDLQTIHTMLLALKKKEIHED